MFQWLLFFDRSSQPVVHKFQEERTSVSNVSVDFFFDKTSQTVVHKFQEGRRVLQIFQWILCKKKMHGQIVLCTIIILIKIHKLQYVAAQFVLEKCDIQ
jgi:hypothetical protein